MATIREIVCGAGANTLREYMCLPVGGGGGLVINSELVFVEAQSPVEVEVVDDLIRVENIEPVLIEVEDDIILITEIEIGELDVLC